jgi:uncharacterized linocin/CFP29 family protein
VEWLIEHYTFADLTADSWQMIQQQAKEMEKEQIIDAANTLLYAGPGPGDTWAEQYYNETYGGNNG